jgi:hypothetical protein
VSNRSASNQFFSFVIIAAFCGVKDYVEEATVDRHFSAIVIDKAKVPELIHETIDP